MVLINTFTGNNARFVRCQARLLCLMCAGSGLCEGPISRTGESCGVCVCVCV